MSRYARDTNVSVEKSRAEIETILARYGASHFAYMTQPGSATVAFMANDRRIRFDLPLPNQTDAHFTMSPARNRPRSTEAVAAAWEQACRQSWRALCLVIKAKLEAVETGITTFESEFMAHIVLSDGRTVGEHIAPKIAIDYQTGAVPALLPPPRAP